MLTKTHLGEIREQEEKNEHRQAFERLRSNVDFAERIVKSASLAKGRRFRQKRVAFSRVRTLVGLLIVSPDICEKTSVESVEGLMEQVGIELASKLEHVGNLATNELRLSNSANVFEKWKHELFHLFHSIGVKFCGVRHCSIFGENRLAHLVQ